MATLTGSTIASSYEQLLSLPDGGGNTSSLVAVTDGDGGTTFCISLTDASTGKAVLAVDGSHASGTEIQIDNSATDGDAFLSFQLSGTSKFTMGVDDGASDIFKIGTTAIGTGTMFALDTSSIISLSNNDSGTSNTLFGKSAGASLDAGSNYNVFIGEAVSDAAMNDATLNTGIGYSALSALTTGDSNVAIGASALAALTSGAGCIAIGKGAQAAQTDGDRNIAIGYEALEDANSGETENIAIGYLAMNNLDHGGADRNIAIGNYAGDAMGAFANTDNIFIGYAAGSNTWDTAASTHNVAIGNYAMNGAMDAANQNTCIGYAAGNVITHGDTNVFVGYLAADAVTDGYQNVCVGASTEPNIITGINQVLLGYGVAGQGNNTVVIGNTSISASHVQVDWTVDSDRRIKKDIEDSDIGLSFINALQTRKFRKKHPAEWDSEILEERYKKGGANYDGEKDEVIKDEFDDEKVWNGLIAQEVKSAMDSSGESFSGWSENYKGKQGIQYSTMVIPLIKAVQELSAKVEELEEKLK